ncbi:MAG: DUF3267 domain-containing protein [Gemmatimonadota bacterium]
MEEAARLAAAISIPIAAAGLLPHLGFWGWESLWQGIRTVFTLWYFIPGLVLTVVLHEGLHALGFRLFGRAPVDSIHFGIDRQTFSPYAGCQAPMSARAYRLALLLPALLLGLLPLVAGWITATGWMTVLGTLQLLGAAGDFVTYRAFDSVPATARVLDHPDRVGCRVIDG